MHQSDLFKGGLLLSLASCTFLIPALITENTVSQIQLRFETWGQLIAYRVFAVLNLTVANIDSMGLLVRK
jgi:hypothetical protein